MVRLRKASREKAWHSLTGLGAPGGALACVGRVPASSVFFEYRTVFWHLKIVYSRKKELNMGLPLICTNCAAERCVHGWLSNDTMTMRKKYQRIGSYKVSNDSLKGIPIWNTCIPFGRLSSIWETQKWNALSKKLDSKVFFSTCSALVLGVQINFFLDDIKTAHFLLQLIGHILSRFQDNRIRARQKLMEYIYYSSRVKKAMDVLLFFTKTVTIDTKNGEDWHAVRSNRRDIAVLSTENGKSRPNIRYTLRRLQKLLKKVLISLRRPRERVKTKSELSCID